MELLDRYLQVVRFWLPKPLRDDVTAELAEEIQSQIDDREAELGRAVSRAEIEAILQRVGNPLVVASRYAPPRALIGPVLFPLYRLVLKGVALFYLLPWLVIWAAFAIFGSDYRSEYPDLAGITSLTSLWLVALHAFAVITLLFAALDRRVQTAGGVLRWTPRLLPPPHANHIPRSSSIGDLTGDVVVLLWWVGVLTLPTLQGVSFSLAPVWAPLHWPIVAFYVASIALAAVNLARPWWTRARSAARLAINAVGLVLAGILLSAGRLVVVDVPGGPASKVAELEQWVNLPIVVTVMGIGVVLLVSAWQDVRRLRRRTPLLHGAVSLPGGK